MSQPRLVDVNLLHLVSRDLLLCILAHLDYASCACFSYASPRLAMQAFGLKNFSHPMFIVERLVRDARPFVGITPALLRKYAAEGRVTEDASSTFPRIKQLSPHLYLHTEVMTEVGSTVGPMRGVWLACLENKKYVVLRLENATTTWHFTGNQRNERLVRIELLDGQVRHLEGEQGHERFVRIEWPGEEVQHLEGEKGHERLVRTECSDGSTYHYHLEGEQRHERLVRIELPDGQVRHIEGEGDDARLVRIERADGHVQHFEGEAGHERLVRAVVPRTKSEPERCGFTKATAATSGLCA